jgi:hypothetical protein
MPKRGKKKSTFTPDRQKIINKAQKRAASEECSRLDFDLVEENRISVTNLWFILKTYNT